MKDGKNDKYIHFVATIAIYLNSNIKNLEIIRIKKLAFIKGSLIFVNRKNV
jgi:hypothetical protein